MEEKKIPEEKEQKIVIPTYPEIDDIKIEEIVLNELLNHHKTNSVEGIFFGRETGKEIIISHVIVCNITQANTQNLINYLEVNRFDSMKIGFFTSNDEFDLINKQKLKVFIEFQKTFPNAVFMTLDSSALKVNLYPFKCFRISQTLMELVDMCEIEEDITLNPNNIDEFYQKVFKNYVIPNKILKPLSFTVIEDSKKLFKILADKTYENDLEDDSELPGPERDAFKYSINRKM